MWQIQLFSDGALKDKCVLLTTQPNVDTGDSKMSHSFLVSYNLYVGACV